MAIYLLAFVGEYDHYCGLLLHGPWCHHFHAKSWNPTPPKWYYATTSQPVTTEPSGMTVLPETTCPVDDDAVIEEIKALFNDKSSWYYRALVDEFVLPSIFTCGITSITAQSLKKGFSLPNQTVALINNFKNYFLHHGQTIYENPSPGNKKGGISTLEDKSLGYTQKSGSALVKGMLSYGEQVKTPGLNLLSAPGNDLVDSTALAAAGAQIVLFTTGRGTPFACPVPTIKIATNSALAIKNANWIDFNAGVLVEDTTMQETAENFFSYVLEVASGRKVCSEEAGYHDMAIFKQGVTLC